MATITLAGLTTPYAPNSGVPFWDTDSVPGQAADQVPSPAADTVLTSADVADETSPSVVHAAPSPVRLLSIVQTDTQLQATFDAPVLIDPGTETHLPARHWFFGSPPQIINRASTGEVIQAVSRLLNRLPRDHFISRVQPGPLLLSSSPTSGSTAGGLSATLSGSGFQSGLAVLFGGASSSIGSVTSNSVSVVTPPHLASLVDVTLINPDGQSSTLAGAFQYSDPAAYSIFPATGWFSGGDAVTIVGSNFVSGATVTFNGIPATSVVTADSGHITCVIPSSTLGSAAVVVTNPDGHTASLSGFAYVGPLIPDDAGTVFHLYVHNGIIGDVKGNTITEVGSLTRVSSTSMGFPNGKTAEGITSFAIAKYLSIPGVLNFTGSFYITVLGKTGPGPISGFTEIVGASSGAPGSAAGYDIEFDTAAYQSQSPFYWTTGAGAVVGAIVTSGVNSIFILSAGVTSGLTSGHIINKLNTVAAVDNGAIGFSGHVASAIPARIGVGAQSTQPNGSAWVPFDGQIFEIRATTTPPSTAILDALHTAIRSNP